MNAEEALTRLRQDGRSLERYVGDFLELANQLRWHDAALGFVFQMGLDEDMIRCDLPVCNYPLIELINVVLYLNGSDLEVEECHMSNRPAPSEARRVVSGKNTSGIPAYRANGSARQPRRKQTPLIQGSIGFLSPDPAASSRKPSPAASTRTPAALAASTRTPPVVRTRNPAVIAVSTRTPPAAGPSRFPLAHQSVTLPPGG
ncbi:vegetative cell wall gp1-like isoform X4 [Labeo rohita]|uniref:Vegetative cell wall gp1-like isoform X4 n=1 Tax=Labeo rohita TaxID=84645 RepID=A0A498MGB5_LABRO|nr:vegetative cell wall gp1-like isoform X4 [Labeo rohita]